MELLADFTNLSIGEAEAFLKCAFPVMFSQSVFVTLVIVFYSNSFQMPLFEYSVFNAVLSIESAYTF